MNIGVILAGGVGMRMGNVDIPKQFIEIYGKPLIVHTMESFDTHPEIDGIVIVALKEWHEDIRIWLRKYEINKVKAIVDG
ncbi:IspD/TarI family cytidylyltransferase, partial [Bacillus cereus]